MPIRLNDGSLYGTLCAVDPAPGPVKDEQAAVLQVLARLLATQIELDAELERRAVAEKRKDEILSIVSHELKTPLTSMRGSLGLLAAGLLVDEPERGQRMATVALTNADRLLRLIEGVLDLDRLDRGEDELRLDVLDAGRLAEQARDTMQGLAHDQGVPIDVQTTAGLTFHGDADRLLQVLTNLVSNAIKYSPAGGPVTIAVLGDTDHVRFEVRDRGRGVPPELRETIFEPYRLVDRADRTERGGSGLGLAIARRIVQQHRGRVGVTDAGGPGSVFFVEIPR